MTRHRHLAPRTGIVVRARRPALLGGVIGAGTALLAGLAVCVAVGLSSVGVHFTFGGPAAAAAVIGSGQGPTVSHDLASASSATPTSTAAGRRASADQAVSKPAAAAAKRAASQAAAKSGAQATSAPTSSPAASASAQPTATSAPAPAATSTPAPASSATPAPTESAAPVLRPSPTPTPQATQPPADSGSSECFLVIICS